MIRSEMRFAILRRLSARPGYVRDLFPHIPAQEARIRAAVHELRAEGLLQSSPERTRSGHPKLRVTSSGEDWLRNHYLNKIGNGAIII